MSTNIKLNNANGTNAELVISNPDTNLIGRTIDISKVAHQVNTIADLRAMTEKPDTVYVTGYHTAGDGAFGSHFFKRVDSAGADNAGTIIVPNGATTYHYALQYEGAVNVKWFGAVGDGVTDDSSVIQHTVDNYNNIVLEKHAVGKSIFLPDNVIISGGSLIEIGNSSDFTIAILINKNHNSSVGNDNITIRDIDIIGKNSTPIAAADVTSSLHGIGGIYLTYCTNVNISDVSVRDSWSGIVVYGTRDNYSTVQNININNCKVTNAASWNANSNAGVPRGFNLSALDTRATNLSALLCATGFYCSGEKLKISNCIASRWTYDNGYYCAINNMSMSNCDATGNNYGNGFAIAYGQNNLVVNCRALNCGHMGFRIHAPERYTSLSNCFAENCGYSYKAENTLSFISSSISVSSGIATIDLGAPNLFETDMYIEVSGSSEELLNGLHIITSVSGNTITFNTSVADGTYSDTITSIYVVEGIQITNSISKSPVIDNFNFYNAVDVGLSNNTIYGGANDYGFTIGSSEHINIAYNNVYNTTKQGAYITSSSEVNIIGNNFSMCKKTTDTASNKGVILFYASDNLSISNNNITSPRAYSIFSSTVTPLSNSISIDNNYGTLIPQLFSGNISKSSGFGSPENVVHAAVGSVYNNKSGGSSTSIYIKESGDGTNSGWVAK